MTWSWRFVQGDGTPVPEDELAAPGFPTRSDAETWIGEQWRSLRSNGVDSVLLLEDDHEVYGPMRLDPTA
ncbi:hypothetical protein EV189_1343 [Motilibacter rhizosphaerae]|uniref:Uncharacterized protein n=1 Tax=Motilibacter rhizosphaerae TaxID=598652 RepID=A0A4Q7NR84_9ACTN|nr:hypothetical protein [Motilibacter rhizosphaerae]RZS89576.1 hypothetical protein EV189_1343 [Motilibacter rhizosphaerae]